MHSTTRQRHEIALWAASTISLAAVCACAGSAIARPIEYSTRLVMGREIKSEDKNETCPTCMTEDGQSCCPH